MINDTSYINTIELIKASLWGGKPASVQKREYEEFKKQSLLMLPANILHMVNMPEDVYHNWKKDILYQMSYGIRYKYEQANLPITIPYVILKGTSAAQYYPQPDYRTMGDIDIITRREDYTTACSMLLANGYKDITSNHTEDFGRHRCFLKNGIIVEVHAFFALLNDTQRAEWLDNIIIDNINPTHMLPDMINGLVLLEHIDQHMEGGLGFRQIIDWMMFVNRCLDDRNWPIFMEKADIIGLRQLAEITTKMCELYLGLPQHTWCKDADICLCNQLMNYILSCGNFGVKQNDKDARVRVFTYSRSPLAALRHIQERGKNNWKAAQKYHMLKPFAWTYQIAQYIIHGVKKLDSSNIISEYETAKERIALFDSLGVTQASKGYAVYQNGKYIKTYKKP